MSFLPDNPPIITREFSCTDVAGGLKKGRQGPLLWEGRCAGFYVQSWPHVEQSLEIIDVDDPSGGNTMSIIPTPGKPIHFGKVKSVQLRQWFKGGLLVDWRIILEAFIDPIFGMVHSSSQGHAQWMPVYDRDQVVPGLAIHEFEFYAWADGILRVAFNCSGGAWTGFVRSFCEGGATFSLSGINHPFVASTEHDLIKARVTAGRRYIFEIQHDQVGNETFNMDVGIIKDPIDQT